MTYTYTDRDGDSLRIESDTTKAGSAYIRSQAGVFVPAVDLPAIVAELYKAADQDSPILLPRYRPQETMTRASKVQPAIPLSEGMKLGPEDARHIASWYATAADLADAEAEAERVRERDQVEQLADVVDGSTPLSRDDAETIARAVLAAGYSRSES